MNPCEWSLQDDVPTNYFNAVLIKTNFTTKKAA
jgi:hypothetical protein